MYFGTSRAVDKAKVSKSGWFRFKDFVREKT